MPYVRRYQYIDTYFFNALVALKLPLYENKKEKTKKKAKIVTSSWDSNPGPLRQVQILLCYVRCAIFGVHKTDVFLKNSMIGFI